MQQFGAYDMRASLDMLDPINRETGKTLSLRARKTLTLGLDRRLTSGQLGVELQAVGERFDNAANTIVLPGYALLNLNASTPIVKDWHLVLRIDNASDTQYQQVGQYATPGRSFYAGIKWQPN
jgi:vitamin B12 transporter